MTNETLFLHRFMGYDIPEDYVEWAVQLLCEGLDSPSLRILAGLDPKFKRDEIEPYFVETCKELDIDIPPRVQEPRATARLIKKVYDLGKLSAEAAISMMAELCKKAGYSDPLLQVWFDIEEELALKGSGDEGYFYPPEKLNSLNEVFEQEWDLFARAYRLKVPEKFMRFIRCDRCGYIGEPELKHKLFRLQYYHTCSRCKSSDYHNMIDPEVRDDYFSRLENDAEID